MKHNFSRLISAVLFLLICAHYAWGATVTFTAGTDKGSGSVEKSGITVSMSTMDRNDNYRCNSGTSMTVDGGSITITKIELTSTASGTSTYGPGKFTGSGYSYSGTKGTWSGSATSITLSASAQVRMTEIVVTYEAATSIDVTLSRDGVTSGPTSQTSPYSLPTTGETNPCEAWVFDGWYGSAYAKSTDKPTYITQMTSSGTAYAVYKHTEISGGGSDSKTFNFANIASANGWSNGVAYTTIEVSPVTISAEGGGNNGKWYTSGGGSWRVYSGGTVRISVDGGDVTSVTSSPSCSFTISDGEATFSPGARTDFTSITVEYTGSSSTTYYSTSSECVVCALTGITLNTSGVTKSFTQGDAFSSAGLIVTAAYSNCSNKVVTPTSISTPDMSTIGDKTVTVSYTEGGVTKTADYTITVNAPTTYAIRFFNNGVQVGETQNVIEGQSATKPSPNPTACEGYTFAGWWTTELPADNTTAHSWVTDFTATQDQDYYAIYSHTESSGGGSGSKVFTFSEIADANNWENSLAYTSVAISPVTITAEGGGNNGKWYTSSGGSWRMYSGGTVRISVEDGTVTSVTSSPSCDFTISNDEATFSPGARTDFTVITVGYTVGSSTTTYTSTAACCAEVNAPEVNVTPHSTRATISWNNQSGATNGYSVTVKQSSTTVYENNAIPAGTMSCEVTGLIANTNYSYTVTAKGATCNRSANGYFITTGCEDVPQNIIVTPGVKHVTVRWTAEAATATVRIYSDEWCNTLVREKTNMTSPDSIRGLQENTQYYLKIWAGGACVSAVVPFTTQTTAVEVAEWYPDGININLTADEAEATVLIEDKQEKAATTSNYADSIFFSKYFEATSNTKLLAIFNGTDHNVDLSDYQLAIAQASTTFDLYPFTGMLYRVGSTSYHFSSEQLLLAPGKEIILISYPDGNASDAAIIECAMNNPNSGFNTYYRLVSQPNLQFNGDDPIGLVNPQGYLIDLIGAGTLGGGANTSAVDETSQSGASGGHYHGFMDKPGGWYTTKGYHAEDGDAETNNYELSTNRCLLIRRNHVKSGLDAVERNLTDFLTLGDYKYLGDDYEGEWKGVQIPGAGCNDGNCAGVTAACTGFDQVGSYNYNQYYAQYDSVTTVEELSGFKKEDGTYRIPIPQLDTLSCTMLRVKVYEDKVEKASAEYKVPIMVEGNKQTNDEIFKKHEIPTCKECDVVILKNATLEKTSGANDRDEIRNLTIYPGGTLIVPSDKGDYTVQSVQFRVEKETAPVAKLNGNLITKTEQVIVSRRIKNDRFYFFSLPYDCNIADIRWSNGETPVRGVDYEIVEYDGARRALEGSTQGAPGHWTPVSGTQLKAGVGYNIAVASDIYKELVFPMDIGQTNLTNKENTKTAKTVAIHQYTNAGTTINNHNWNLVAHPYVSAFSAYEGDYIKAGKLVYTEPANPGDKGTWHRDEETTNVYLTMPSFNSGGITYTQTLSTTISQLDPFLAVFVQGAGEGDLTFEQSARKLSAPARHLAAKAEDEDESIFAGVILSGNGESDQTNLRIRPDFTDEYQLGYDLEKFITFYTSRPQVYMKTPSYRLAFQAVSDEVAKSTFLPMGVYCYQAGTYTFTLSDRYPIDEIEAVYLFDKQTGVTTNLLYDSYSFTATKQVYTNTRFSLNVIVKRRILESPTGVENLEAPDSMVRKILIDGHVYIQRGKAVYDLTGKSMLNQ